MSNCSCQKLCFKFHSCELNAKTGGYIAEFVTRPRQRRRMLVRFNFHLSILIEIVI